MTFFIFDFLAENLEHFRYKSAYNDVNYVSYLQRLLSDKNIKKPRFDRFRFGNIPRMRS